MNTPISARRVLIVSGSRQIYEFITDILHGDDFDAIAYAASVGEARRALSASEYDILIVNTPLPDEFGADFSLGVSGGRMGILLLCKGELYEQVVDRVEEYGILTLPKPTTKQAIYTSIHLLIAVSAKLSVLEKKNKTLQEKMADIRVVNRAKWLLIENLGMTEKDAHYYIEKQAMDMRLSRREVAEYIIRTYDK